MMPWILAALAGLALAALSYRWREPGPFLRLAPLMLLRALALTLLLALLFDAPGGAGTAPRPLVALDASASWLRGGDSVRWRRALSRSHQLGGDSVLLFGDSVRRLTGAAPPSDASSRIGPLAERALGSGRPLIVLTDGEIDDPAAGREFPSGTRVEVSPAAGTPDVALVAFDAPRAVVSGDTVTMRVSLRGGSAVSGRGTLSLLVGGKVIATVPIEPVPAAVERTVEVRAALVAAVGATVLTAAASTENDPEPRNDTLGLSLDVSRAAGAVLVSSSPDYDARFLLPVLRGAVALPTRAYFRVAPGNWRLDGALAPVPENDVRAALHDAPLAIIHGDTAVFGPPVTATTSSLALIAPPADTGGEWYGVAAPPSPLAAALSGLLWDSLPPLDVGVSSAPHDWEGLSTARARQFERRPAVLGTEAPRRRVVVPAAGFWRWRFRGGASADAYAALWGGIFDWLSAERNDPRGAIPAEGIVRAGDRIRWRRGSGVDTAVMVALHRRGALPRTDSLVLAFARGSNVAESEPLPSGVYDVAVKGGRTVLVVNASRELLPRPVTVRTGLIGGAPVPPDRPRLRDRAWPYLLALGALCLEWLARRRRGLR